MSDKPGLFSRLKNSISSTLSDAVDSVSDPGQEIALMLDDLAEGIKQSEKDLKEALVGKKMLERKIEEMQVKERDWQGRAEQALKLGDEELARAALKKKGDYTLQLRENGSAVNEQQHIVDTMGGQIKEAKAKLKSLNLRRGSLMAQARAAKKGVSSGTIGDGGSIARLDAIENRIAEMEALNEVNRELGGDAVEEAELDAKLANLAGESELDDELAALKAKMGGGPQGQLAAGGDDADDA
ncbi:MAG: PspA/IM30 family protein [Nannocystaceae bacterium]|nr:PspA/IM30 family protein [Nannocystaceae bacterium]